MLQSWYDAVRFTFMATNLRQFFVSKIFLLLCKLHLLMNFILFFLASLDLFDCAMDFLFDGGADTFNFYEALGFSAMFMTHCHGCIEKAVLVEQRVNARCEVKLHVLPRCQLPSGLTHYQLPYREVPCVMSVVSLCHMPQHQLPQYTLPRQRLLQCNVPCGWLYFSCLTL